VALALVVPVLGPPGAGKTTLTTHLARMPGRRVFRLREHVSTETLIATASSADRLGWIDDATVATGLHHYVDLLVHSAAVHTVDFRTFSSQMGPSGPSDGTDG